MLDVIRKKPKDGEKDKADMKNPTSIMPIQGGGTMATGIAGEIGRLAPYEQTGGGGTMMGMQQAPAANQFANNQYGGGIANATANR